MVTKFLAAVGGAGLAGVLGAVFAGPLAMYICLGLGGIGGWQAASNNL